MMLDDGLDLLGCKSGAPHQSIEPGERLRTAAPASEVEAGACRRGHRQPGNPRDLVVGEPVQSPNEARLAAASGPKHVNWGIRVDPGRTVQGRGSRTGDHAVPAGGQPSSDGPLAQRQGGILRDIDSLMDPAIPAAELMAGEASCRYRLTADDYLVHARIVAEPTDTFARSTLFSESSSESLHFVALGAVVRQLCRRTAYRIRRPGESPA